MILETFIVAGLAKLGFVVTAVKISKRKKQTGKVAKKEQSQRISRMIRHRKHKKVPHAQSGSPNKDATVKSTKTAN